MINDLSPLKGLIRWLKYLFTPLAVLCLAYFIWESRGYLFDLIRTTDPEWLLAGVACWFALHFISPLFTAAVFKASDASMAYPNAFYIHASRLPAKYLPGGIWHTVIRAADYHEQGFAGRHITSYLLLENLVAAGVTLLIGGAAVMNLQDFSTLWWKSAALAAGLALIMLVLIPRIFNKMLLPTDAAIPADAYTKGIAYIVLYWLVAATSFICYLKAFPGLVIAVSYFEAGGIYLFSWGVGFIALFAPQGLGVSELVSGELLDSSAGFTGTVALLVGFRLCILLADLSAWSFSFAFRHRAP